MIVASSVKVTLHAQQKYNKVKFAPACFSLSSQLEIKIDIHYSDKTGSKFIVASKGTEFLVRNRSRLFF